MIDPKSLAFDIDGVVADTMTLFLDIAREQYHIKHLAYEDITSYSIEDCIDMDPEILTAIIDQLTTGAYSLPLLPIDGVPGVIHRIAKRHSPILFVTARPFSGPMQGWMEQTLGLAPTAFEIVATGTSENKATVLIENNISYFVDDRLDTCYRLDANGIKPVLFKQPWNRQSHPFEEVGSWRELEGLIDFNS